MEEDCLMKSLVMDLAVEMDCFNWQGIKLEKKDSLVL